MAAVAPELQLTEAPLREAPFLYRLQRRIEEYALLARLEGLLKRRRAFGNGRLQRGAQ